MGSYMKNYGYTKTMIQENGHKKHNELQWKGDYDGNIAHIDIGINDNGHKGVVSMELTNKDLRELLGVQPVETPLEKRLLNDFLYDDPYKYRPISLEGALIPRRTHKHRRRRSSKTRSSHHDHRRKSRSSNHGHRRKSYSSNHGHTHKRRSSH